MISGQGRVAHWLLLRADLLLSICIRLLLFLRASVVFVAAEIAAACYCLLRPAQVSGTCQEHPDSQARPASWLQSPPDVAAQLLAPATGSSSRFVAPGVALGSSLNVAEFLDRGGLDHLI